MKLRYIVLTALWLSLGGIPLTASATKVRLSGLDPASAVLTNKATNEEVEIREALANGHTPILELDPGTYILGQQVIRGEKYADTFASFEFKVGQPEEYDAEKGMSKIITSARIHTHKYEYTDGNNGYYWEPGVDFNILNLQLLDEKGNQVVFKEAPLYISENSTNADGFYVLSFVNYTVKADFTPTDKYPDYLTTRYEKVIPRTGIQEEVRFDKGTTFTFSFPSDAKGELTYKKGSTNYVPFVYVAPETENTENGITTYTYTVPVSSQQYCYRVTRSGDITHAGLFTPEKTTAINITDESLKLHSNKYFAHDVSTPANGTHYADIFLNINKRGLLRMKNGEKFQIVNLRTWQLTNNSTANYFVEPDYSWTILNSNFEPDNTILDIDDHGVLTAKAPGTAIVQVRYDALNLSAMDGDLWDALWAENTGTFVVTVDADETKAPADNIRLAYKPDFELDAEHDILYYIKGEDGYRLTFTPAEGTTVAVANPLIDSEANTVSYPNGFSADNVTVNEDGSVTALLTFGRNIIRTSDTDGNANYQVLSAKPSTLDLSTSRDDNYIIPGDNVKMQFGGLFHVAGKLASIYNANCHVRYGDVTYNDGVVLGTGQYDFAGNPAAQRFDVTIAPDQKENLLMSGGCLNPQGYGSSPGAHRGITYEKGLDPNFNAGVVSGSFGSLPDKEIIVTQLKDVDRLKVTLPLGSRALPVTPAAMAAAFGEDAHWVITDENIARIGDGMEVFPVAAGQSTLTAVKNGDDTPLLLCDVIVPENPDFVPVTGITLDHEGVYEIMMNFSWGNWGNYGNELYAHATPSDATNNRVRFTTSNPEIVAFSKTGAASLETNSRAPLFWNDATRAPGESLITVETLDGGFKKQVLVRWMKPADSIETDLTEVEVEVGESTPVMATVSPTDCSYPVVWTSSNPEVATVDEDSNITGVAEGTATVTASAKNRYGSVKANVNVTVVPKTETGIEGVTADRFSFRPNPARDFITVTSANSATLEIYSMDGGRMLTAALEAGANSVDVSRIPAGVYMLRVGDKTRKLIKK